MDNYDKLIDEAKENLNKWISFKGDILYQYFNYYYYVPVITESKLDPKYIDTLNQVREDMRKLCMIPKQYLGKPMIPQNCFELTQTYKTKYD